MGTYNTESGEVSAAQRTMGPIMSTFMVLTRAGGLVLLVVGIATLTRVVIEAWGLYEDPAKIVRFAEAIESGSNIDKILLPRNRSPDGDSGSSSGQRYRATGNDLRPSYFLAWIVAIPLLLAVGMVALWTTKAGAELTFHSGPRP